jgi:hypothetical protein
VASRSVEGWGPIYSTHRFMIIGGVRTSDISDVDRICPMGGSNWLEFSWVRYIRWSSDIFIFGGVRALWNPTKGWIHPVGQIYPMGVGYV